MNTRLTVYCDEGKNPVKLSAALNRPVPPDALGALWASRISGNNMLSSPKMRGPKQKEWARGGFITSFNICIYEVKSFTSINEEGEMLRKFFSQS
jgi:hypothetical protein